MIDFDKSTGIFVFAFDYENMSYVVIIYNSYTLGNLTADNHHSL